MEQQKRIAQARAETVQLLTRALSYSDDFQKPAQIDYYTRHIDFLDALARGETVTPPKPNTAAWDDMRCVINARAHA